MSQAVKYNFDGLNRFVKAVSDKHVVKLGIFGKKNARGGKGDAGNADLGAIHEFGSFQKHIPARSFLRMPMFVRTKQILADTAKGAQKQLAEGNMVGILKRLGIAAEKAVQEAFESRGFGTWKANKPATIRRKGSDAPLIDTAQLRRSVTSKVDAA